MARYLVTGGTGFLGRALTRAIVANGDEVVVAGRGRDHGDHSRHWVEYDLCDRTTIANLIEAQPDGIFHLAWSTTPSLAERDPATDVGTNLGGMLALLSALAERMQVPIVLASSGGTVYGPTDVLPIKEDHPLRPISIYGITKASAEAYAANYCSSKGLDIRIARLSNPFGAEQSAAKLQGAASIFARRIINCEPITIWGDGTTVRDYLSVDDASAALIKIMLSKTNQQGVPQIYNVGSGEGYSLNQLLESLSEMAGVRAKVTFDKRRSFDIPANILDISRISEKTNWTPRPTRTTLKQMLDILLRAKEPLRQKP